MSQISTESDQKNVASKTQTNEPGSPSVGGFSLDTENKEIDASKPLGTGFSLTLRKFFMILWNFKAFGLVVWGFFGLIEATVRSFTVRDMSEFVLNGNTATHLTAINPDYTKINCVDTELQNWDVQTYVYPLAFPFLVLNIAWILWIVVKSNILFYSTESLGFHVSLVEVRKNRTYKIWAVIDGLYCFAIIIYGLKRVSAEEPSVRSRAMPVLLNGAFQVYLGLWDLYSPLEETLSYGPGAMVSPMKCSIFTEAGKAMNVYQDALLAALTRKPNTKWIEAATGASKMECEQALFEISAKEHPSEKEQEQEGFSFC